MTPNKPPKSHRDEDIAMGFAIPWLFVWLIIAIIGIFWIGIDSIALGLLFYVFVVIVGLLPILLITNGGFQGLKENVIAYCKAPTWPFPKGYFMTVLYGVFMVFKYIFIMLAVIWMAALFATSGKRYGGMK